ncbi:SRPBCC family protein [Modestobacter sp. I12A-02662]|uniref:SRPBCC family protein n=1 Tax=Modestobacter sp. I12A-02662 TaxID=1730496 RepID=UPI0034DE705D
MTGPRDERLGRVTEVPEGVQVQFRRSWPDPIEDVWAALTEDDRTARWFGSYEGERRVGGSGTLTMTHEGESAGEPMRIVECDPPRRLVVQWESEQAWRIQLDLTEEQDRTVLLFTQVFPPGTDAGDYVLGWHWYLDKLGAEVSGGAGPGSWEEFLAARRPAYGG